MVCRVCGRTSSDKAVFCTGCGTRLEPVHLVDAPYPGSQAPAPPTSEPPAAFPSTQPVPAYPPAPPGPAPSRAPGAETSAPAAAPTEAGDQP